MKLMRDLLLLAIMFTLLPFKLFALAINECIELLDTLIPGFRK